VHEKAGSFCITATYCDRRGACEDKTKIGIHVPMFRYSPAVFHPIFLKCRGLQEPRIRLSLRRLPTRPRRKKFRFRLPQLFRSPQLFKRRPLMGLPRLVRRSASSWFVFVINPLSVGLFALFPNPTGFFVFGPVCSGISLGFALRQLQLSPPWLIMDVCRRDDCT